MKVHFFFVSEEGYSQVVNCSIQAFQSAHEDAEKYYNNFYFVDCVLGGSINLTVSSVI